MNVIFGLLFLGALLLPKSNVYYRDFTNITGFTIATGGLTINGGYPAIYQRTGNGGVLLMTGIFAYVAYYTAKDEIKCIKVRKQGGHYMAYNNLFFCPQCWHYLVSNTTYTIECPYCGYSKEN